MKKYKSIVMTVFFSILFLFQSSAMFSIDFSLLGVRTYTVFGFLPAPTGTDIKLGVTSPGMIAELPATVSLTLGGGYESETVYRTSTGGNLSTVADQSQVEIDRFEVYFEPAFTQQLTDAPLVAYLGARVYFRENIPSQDAVFSQATHYPDEVRLLLTSIKPGVRYNSVDKDRPHGDRSGIDAGAMIELAPSFLGNRIVGNSDFMRFNIAGRIYLPVYDIAPEREMNLFNIYYAQQASVDWITGNSVPLHEQSKFGGFYPSAGMGGNVRGFVDREYSALFKSVLNTEVRFVGPALFLNNIFPVLVTFIDVGYFSGFMADGYFQPPADTIELSDISKGLLASAGATLTLNVMDFLYLGYTIALPLAGTRADASAFAGKLDIGLHF